MLEITYNSKVLQNWKSIRITRSCQSAPSTCELTVATVYPGTAPIIYACTDTIIVKSNAVTMFTGFVDSVQIVATKENHEISLQCRSKLADLVDGCNLLLTNSVEAPNVAALAKQVVDKHNSMVKNPAYQIKIINRMATPGPRIPPVPLQQTATSFEIIEYYTRYASGIAFDNEDGDLVLATAGTTRAAGSVNLGQNVQILSFTTSSKDRFTDYYAVWSDVLAWQDKNLTPPNITGMASDAQMKATGRFRPLVFIANQFDYTTGKSLAQARALWESKIRYGRSNSLKLTVDTWTDANGALFQPNTLISSTVYPVLGASAQTTNWIIASVTFDLNPQTGTTAELTLFPPDAFTPEPIGLNNPYRDIIDPAKTQAATTPSGGPREATGQNVGGPFDTPSTPAQ